MSVEKLYISYNEIHQAIADCVNEKNVYEAFKPTLIIAIGSGACAWASGRRECAFSGTCCCRSLSYGLLIAVT